MLAEVKKFSQRMVTAGLKKAGSELHQIGSAANARLNEATTEATLAAQQKATVFFRDTRNTEAVAFIAVALAFATRSQEAQYNHLPSVAGRMATRWMTDRALLLLMARIAGQDRLPPNASSRSLAIPAGLSLLKETITRGPAIARSKARIAYEGYQAATELLKSIRG